MEMGNKQVRQTLQALPRRWASKEVTDKCLWFRGCVKPHVPGTKKRDSKKCDDLLLTGEIWYETTF